MIYFTNGREGIFRVPHAGGDPVRVTKVDAAGGEQFHAYPHLLPDGRHLLILVLAASTDKSAVYMISLDGKERKQITATQRGFVYVPPQEGQGPGHLLILKQDVLMALPVNPRTMDPAGDPFPIAEHIGSRLSEGFFAASPNGVLAYRTGGSLETRRLVWVDRSGKELGTVGTSGEYTTVALSPDGAHAAVTLNDANSANPDIWLIDLARGVPSRFTFHESIDTDPVWSPDGSKIVFSSQRDGAYALYWKDSNGAAQEERLVKPEIDRPCDWSPDGRYIMFRRGGAGGGLWTIEDPSDPAKRKVSPYLKNEYTNSQGQFSPGKDGPRWVAYSSNESKRGFEVYVQSFPAGAGKYQISTGGGTQPRWRRDGKELFYIATDGKLMAVDVKLSPRFEAGIPHALFDSQIYIPTANVVFRYDMTPDGKRFLIDQLNQAPSGAPIPITVVVNWLAVKK
jgi:Tol biopolymer transport system component